MTCVPSQLPLPLDTTPPEPEGLFAVPFECDEAQVGAGTRGRQGKGRTGLYGGMRSLPGATTRSDGRDGHYPALYAGRKQAGFIGVLTRGV